MDQEAEAYIVDARRRLKLSASTIHDLLTSNSDLFVKTCLLDDIAAVDESLRKALM